MHAKSILTFIALLTFTPACAAEATDEGDESGDDSVVSTTSAAVRAAESSPGPLDYPLPTPPGLEFPGARPLRGRLPFFDPREVRPGLQTSCYVKFAAILNPFRGEKVEIPITVCN